MSTNLPTKTSSRSGRFKKILLPEDALPQEAMSIESKMRPILEKFHQGQYSSAEFAAIYVITVLSHRYPGTWAGAKKACPIVEHHQLKTPLSHFYETWEPNIRKRLAELQTIGDVFNHFSLRSTPISVNRSILEWSNGKYGLELMFRIPLPHEVLHQQKRGRRCVTVILEKEKASKLILGQRDALGFTMHDLIHADHFYFDNQCYMGQLGFYGFLDFCHNRGDFSELLENAAFENEYEYLISDMNAYAIHLLKCFKSALTHYHPEKLEHFEKWLMKLELDLDEMMAFLALNTSGFNASHDKTLLNFLEKFRFLENATSHKNKD